MSGQISLKVGSYYAREVASLRCLCPPGASIVGWVDFDPEKGPRMLYARRYALLLLRSGRAIASRGSDIRAIPEALFSYIRLNCGS